MPKTDVNGERRIGDVGIAGSLFVPQHVKGVKERILYAFQRYFLSCVSYFIITCTFTATKYTLRIFVHVQNIHHLRIVGGQLVALLVISTSIF